MLQHLALCGCGRKGRYLLPAFKANGRVLPVAVNLAPNALDGHSGFEIVKAVCVITPNFQIHRAFWVNGGMSPDARVAALL